MPLVKIGKLHRILEIPADRPLMQELLAQQIPVASSCSGDGICCKCKIQVLSGNENLTPITKIEERHRQDGKLGPQERLACQCSALGQIEISTTYW